MKILLLDLLCNFHVLGLEPHKENFGIEIFCIDSSCNLNQIGLDKFVKSLAHSNM